MVSGSDPDRRAPLRNQAGATTFVGSYPRDLPDLGLPEVAFAGRSNVGKSSALNKLLGSKKIARVSRTPGRTQLINLFKVGSACVFVDLPGYGYAEVPDQIRGEWKGMIEGYLANRAALRLVVVLVDSRREPQESDGQIVEALAIMRIPTLVVATKVDKLTRNERIVQLRAIREAFDLEDQGLIGFSSVTGDGVSEVWSVIEELCEEPST